MAVDTPLISIIVPVYKVEPYLRRCLDSIVNQTYRNLEIILVDDGSPDDCGAVCDEYAAHDGRIIVIHQENQGLSAARNTALDIITGDYVQFVDSDDWLELNACESALKDALEQHSDLVCFGFNTVFPSGEIRSRSAATSGIQQKHYIMTEFIWRRWVVLESVWCSLYERKLFDGIRFPVGRLCEDVGTMYRLIHKARVVFVSSAVLYNYYQRSNSIMSGWRDYSVHRDRIYLYTERLDFLQMHYPDLVDLQLALMLKEILVFKQELKGGPHEEDMKQELDAFISQYEDRITTLAKYTRVVWCYQYCRPLLPLVIKWRRWD